jgi:hypothetical protein
MSVVLRICGIKYRVRFLRQLVGSEGTGYSGLIRHEKQEIELLHGMGPDFARTVLLHELIHAALTNTGQVEAGANESLIDALATALAGAEVVWPDGRATPLIPLREVLVAAGGTKKEVGV